MSPHAAWAQFVELLCCCMFFSVVESAPLLFWTVVSIVCALCQTNAFGVRFRGCLKHHIVLHPQGPALPLPSRQADLLLAETVPTFCRTCKWKSLVRLSHLWVVTWNKRNVLQKGRNTALPWTQKFKAHLRIWMFPALFAALLKLHLRKHAVPRLRV